jgi:hypothetical protein
MYKHRQDDQYSNIIVHELDQYSNSTWKHSRWVDQHIVVVHVNTDKKINIEIVH